MAQGVFIDLQLEENISAALGRAIAAGADLTPAMQDIANHLAASSQLRFEREAAPDGKPWKPSKRVTDNPGEKTLSLSRDLRNSIRADWGADYAAAGPERSGGAAIYAKIHQFGGTIVPKKGKALSFGGGLFAKVVMPARPYLGFDDTDVATIGKMIGDHIGSALGGAAGAQA